MTAIKDLLTTASQYDAKAYAPTVLAEIENISGLTAALNGKAASSHTHIIDDVTGLQEALDAKEDAET